MAHHDMVVIGGSTGSGAVLKRLVGELPGDLPAAVFISTHVQANGPGHLPSMLGSISALPVSHAIDGQPVELGRIYVAPPDRHLLVIDHTIRLGYGPRENMARPAIDPLFRSAALAFGPRVIGVVLTGMLNDGASGLHAIKQTGGLTVVQHPLDAEADAMPRAALEAVDVDHVAKADALAQLITDLVVLPPGDPVKPSPDLMLEVEIALGRRLGSEQLRKIAEPSAISCPHCDGVLSEMKTAGPLRYRCQTGHAFTAEAAIAAREDQVEEALRLAMRMMEERVELVGRMARDARGSGRNSMAELFEARLKEYQRYAEILREAATASMLAAHLAIGEP